MMKATRGEGETSTARFGDDAGTRALRLERGRPILTQTTAELRGIGRLMTMAIPLAAASVVVLTAGLMALESAPSSRPAGSALTPALPAAAEYVPGADEKYPRLSGC